MRRIQIIKRVSEGEILPPFYGVAWVDWLSNSAMCMPVPLNLVAQVLREVWFACKGGWQEVPRNPRAAYAQGFKDGRASVPVGAQQQIKDTV